MLKSWIYSLVVFAFLSSGSVQAVEEVHKVLGVSGAGALALYKGALSLVVNEGESRTSEVITGFHYKDNLGNDLNWSIQDVKQGITPVWKDGLRVLTIQSSQFDPRMGGEVFIQIMRVIDNGSKQDIRQMKAFLDGPEGKNPYQAWIYDHQRNEGFWRVDSISPKYNSGVFGPSEIPWIKLSRGSKTWKVMTEELPRLNGEWEN